mmetsp:Transcript_11636/g.33490  ORF Transcript_11636/g.33490 Transcript_11636/m.33490 type:complete len:111 (-) Transcript_11636:862-1194(-)
MPELPEVQNFRRLLLPLVSEEHPLRLERQSLEKAPPRKFINDEEIESIHSSGLLVSEVEVPTILVAEIGNENTLREKQPWASDAARGEVPGLPNREGGISVGEARSTIYW